MLFYKKVQKTFDLSAEILGKAGNRRSYHLAKLAIAEGGASSIVISTVNKCLNCGDLLASLLELLCAALIGKAAVYPIRNACKAAVCINCNCGRSAEDILCIEDVIDLGVLQKSVCVDARSRNVEVTSHKGVLGGMV